MSTQGDRLSVYKFAVIRIRRKFLSVIVYRKIFFFYRAKHRPRSYYLPYNLDVIWFLEMNAPASPTRDNRGFPVHAIATQIDCYIIRDNGVVAVPRGRTLSANFSQSRGTLRIPTLCFFQ